MILVGLCGKKYSGKDTVADYLVEHHGFQKKSFAGPLKEACQALFLFSDEQCHDPCLKEVVDPRWGLSPRAALQMMGTDWVRNQFAKDFWVHRMRFDLLDVTTTTRIVISDVRFENEKDLVTELGGSVYRVHRPSSPQKEDGHESETNMDQFADSLPTIVNDGTLEELYEKIDTVLNDILSLP